MLSMKTLKVAIVTMGSALLLGPGFAAATIQILDGTGDDAPSAIKYASQTVPIAAAGAARAATGAITPPGATRPSHYQLMSPNTDADGITGQHVNHKLTVSLSRRVETTDSVYIRLDLGGGMLFAPVANSALSYDAPDNAETPATAMDTGTVLSSYADRTSGGAGHSFVVYNATPEQAIPVGSVIWVDVDDDLAVPASPGSHTAMIRSYGNADDAIDGPGATSTASGSATIVSVESGIHAEVKNNTAIADVATAPEPFLWFKTATGNSSMAVLGSATAIARAAVGVFNADTGDLVVNEQLLPAMALTVGIEGDFSIGAFSLGEPAANIEDDQTPALEALTRMDASTICLDQGTADNDEPEMGNVNKAASEDDPTMSSIGMLSAGTQYLCVQVDRMGAGSNRSPIPVASYTGTITMGSGDTAMVLAEGVIGEIKRNGTTVQVAYLTDSAKYAQRLIIVNRGPVAARFDISGFTSEVGSGTTVELSDAAQAAKDAGLNEIPAGGQVVLRVNEFLTFTGERKRRTGATISINADVNDIQVATTQVNLDTGGTDTVIYASADGARVE